ncbi:MAG: DUF368 domain-containing protein [Alistipes sp.]|nr:DUF368 domain-containing protein [Candidatus Minthomonas equi]
MGAADVIPGVSGGTIAFLTGIYGELVDSIKSIDFSALKLLLSGKIKQFWKHINANFLISVLLGILISVFSLARLMKYLLEYHPIPLWSFFFGLIFVSAIYIFKQTAGFKVSHIVPALLGAAVGVFICLVSPAETPDALWFIFVCGAIGICAMILPGISGSFILLLLGKYEYIVAEAVSSFNIPVLAVFACGALVGIISFSHFLSWMLKKHYDATILFLAGLMIGSLLKVWPWRTSSAQGMDYPVLPADYAGDAQIMQAIIFFLSGVALFLSIEITAKRLKKKE